MKISIIAGARPNFMKIAPLTRAISHAQAAGKNISFRLIYTGTQEDPSIDVSLFSDLEMKAPDTYLGVGYENLSERAAGIMCAFEKELSAHPTDLVLVVDDLTSTMACAIVAKKRNVKVAHLVAGTRSFDLNMPKEVNRMITDGLSDYLFTAGMIANRNLNHSGSGNENVYLVGNILMDTLRYNRNRLIKPAIYDILHLKDKEYILLTINRHALLANEQNLKKLLEAIIKKAQGLPIIVPVHAYVQDKIRNLHLAAPHFHLLPPQNYLCFGYLLNHSKAVITDSGNVAEEATFSAIPCITLNTYAEHPETCSIGTNELAGEDPERTAELMDKLMDNHWKEGNLPERWDGRTAERIVQILLQE